MMLSIALDGEDGYAAIPRPLALSFRHASCIQHETFRLSIQPQRVYLRAPRKYFDTLEYYDDIICRIAVAIAV